VQDDSNEELFAYMALKRAKKLQNESSYIELNFLKPTSNIAEQFLSVAGYAFTDRRKATHPVNL
jgi:hypothetical protein